MDSIYSEAWPKTESPTRNKYCRQDQAMLVEDPVLVAGILDIVSFLTK